ncbi:MAG: helix-turn-helix domain-containing protein [Planctomycetota bacterium]
MSECAGEPLINRTLLAQLLGDSHPELLTEKQLADRLGVSKRTLSRARDENGLPCYRVRSLVRYRWDEALAHFSSQGGADA